MNLKKVKYFKEMKVRIVFNLNYFEEIKGLKSLRVKAKAYLQPKQASMMELSLNIVNGLML